MIKFEETIFAQSLIPNIELIGITNNYIKKLSPYKSMKSWINIGINDKDIEDASYLLLDNNTKLLRSGGLFNDKYTSSVSICDLKSIPFEQKTENDIDDKISSNWISLPKLSHRRHGHETICCNMFNETNIMVIGGFDSKGNTITKSEVISLNNIQSHIKQSLSNKNNKNNNKYWNTTQILELPVGCADFGICQDIINNRIYICGGLDSQFRSLSQSICYDMTTNKWLNLPKLNCQRHCNKAQLLYDNNNPNILMTFGGWTGISRNTIEIIDLRSNSNKWVMETNNNNNNNKSKKGYGIFNYPHSNCASIVKNNNNNIQQKLNGLNINKKNKNKNKIKQNENIVIVCGHRQGLFIETNVMEALDLRTRKWEKIATFKYGQNCNINQNLINAQKTALPVDNNNIDIINIKKYHRYANGFRYLTLL